MFWSDRVDVFWSSHIGLPSVIDHRVAEYNHDIYQISTKGYRNTNNIGAWNGFLNTLLLEFVSYSTDFDVRELLTPLVCDNVAF